MYLQTKALEKEQQCQNLIHGRHLFSKTSVMLPGVPSHMNIYYEYTNTCYVYVYIYIYMYIHIYTYIIMHTLDIQYTDYIHNEHRIEDRISN